MRESNTSVRIGKEERLIKVARRRSNRVARFTGPLQRDRPRQELNATDRYRLAQVVQPRIHDDSGDVHDDAFPIVGFTKSEHRSTTFAAVSSQAPLLADVQPPAPYRLAWRRSPPASTHVGQRWRSSPARARRSVRTRPRPQNFSVRCSTLFPRSRFRGETSHEGRLK